MGDKVKFQEFDPATYELIQNSFKGHLKFARFGDVGMPMYTMPLSYRKDADNIRNMAVRPDDIWVTTFPRSGTTWMQELVWILMNDFDYEKASKIPLLDRYLFLELSHVIHIEDHKWEAIPGLNVELGKVRTFDVMANAPSPRFIKTHMPFSLLPPNLLDTTKVVYVARDPRDVAVSLYYHNKLFYKQDGDFKSYWDLFISDLVAHCPFFPHLKEAWALRHHPNMLFMFYEDMKKDLPSCVKKIAEFLGKVVTDEQIAKLCEHLDIQNFKNNESVNPPWMTLINPDSEGFVRKGKSGAWREHFDEAMAAQAQRWMRENLGDTDLRFPHANSSVATLVSKYNN